MEDNKSLIEVNEKGIWSKIKAFLRKIFRSNTAHQKNTEDDNLSQSQAQINSANLQEESFNENIKVNVNEQLLSLQRKLENQEIDIDDLTEEETEELLDLYNTQIKLKEEKLEKIKNEITKLKKECF